MNVAWVNYYTPAWWYVDTARWMSTMSASYCRSYGWRVNENRVIPLDENGWPTRYTTLTGSITAIGTGNPGVITSPNHQLLDGDHIIVSGANCSPSINGLVRIKKIDGDRFYAYTYDGNTVIPINITSPGTTGNWIFEEYTHGLTIRSQGNHYPRGSYILRFKGKGSVNIAFSASGTFTNTTGEERSWPVSVNPDSSGVQISILSTNESDPVRDIRFIMPGFENTYQTQIFHPDLLDKLTPFSTFRFMDMLPTNNSNVQRWEERMPPNWATSQFTARYSGRIANIRHIPRDDSFWDAWGSIAEVTTVEPHGLASGQQLTIKGIGLGSTSGLITTMGAQAWVTGPYTFQTRVNPPADPLSYDGGEWSMAVTSCVSYETMIALCNRLSRNMWTCVPACANDDYIRQLAILLRDTLDPILKIYIEWSNEVWNWGFAQFLNGKAEGYRHGYGGNFARGYACRCKEIFDIFYDVFGDQASSRLIRVVAGQAVSTWATRNYVLPIMEGKFDALSPATYFGAPWQVGYTADEWLDATIAELQNNTWLPALSQWAALRDQYSASLGRRILLVAYEGGAGLVTPEAEVPTGIEIQTHPKMYTAYQLWLQSQEDYGFDLIIPYSHIGNWGKYGFWGHIRYEDDVISLETTPKYWPILQYALDRNVPIRDDDSSSSSSGA